MNHSWGHHRFPRADYAGTDQANDKWSSCHQYPKYPQPTPKNNYSYNNHQQHGSSNTWSTAELDRPGISSQKWHSSEPEAEEDPDGLPYEPDKEDPELTRKRQELQVIEKQIILKKASIALKTVNVQPSKHRRFTENPHSVESNKTLRERVKHILHLRNREIKTCGSVTTFRRHSLNVQNNHPLKWRVEAALQQRFVAPPVEPQNCKQVPPPSAPVPHQTEPSVEKEAAKKSDQGFMRFLNILNKGVDINKLTEIVKDDAGRLPQSSPTVQNHSATRSFVSPPVEKIKLETKEQQPKTEEQQKHLQNILETLGLSLGTDEISRLGDRTQERLYGKKQSTGEEKTPTEQEQKEREKYSPGHYTRSSSSFSSSSSRSSRTPSPVRRRKLASHVHSRRTSSRSPHSKRTSSQSHRSKQRSSQSPRRNRRLRSPYRKKDCHSLRRSKSPLPEVRPDSHPQYPPPTQPHLCLPPPYFNPHFPPSVYSPAYSYNQCTTHINYWSYNQAPATFNPNYPPGELPFPPPNVPPFPPPNVHPVPPQQQTDQLETSNLNLPPNGTETGSDKFFPQELQGLSDNNSGLVPVAAMSESTVPVKPGELMSKEERALYNQARKAQRQPHKTRLSIYAWLAGAQRKPGAPRYPKLSKSEKKKRKEEREKLLSDKVKVQQLREVPVKDELELEPELTSPLTEEEVKANLKKKLEAFNNRMKKNVTQTPQSLTAPKLEVEEDI